MSDFLVFKPNNEVSEFCFIFAVNAGRVVVVKGRQLALEHGPSCSLRSPGMRPGEAKLGGADMWILRIYSLGHLVVLTSWKPIFNTFGKLSCIIYLIVTSIPFSNLSFTKAE